MKTDANFLIVSRSVYRRMRNVSETHFTISNSFFRNRAVYKIIWKNVVERGRPHMTV